MQDAIAEASGADPTAVDDDFYRIVSDVRRSFRLSVADQYGLDLSIPSIGTNDFDDYLANRHLKEKTVTIRLKSNGRLETRSVLVPKIAPGSTQPLLLEGVLFEIEVIIQDLQSHIDKETLSLDSLLSPEHKKRIIETINEHVGQRFNGENAVLNHSHFNGYTNRGFLARDLSYWHGFVVGLSRQSRDLLCFDKWIPPKGSELKEPTNADKYIHTTLSQPDDHPDKQQLLALINSGPQGYMAVARLFHRGNMHKAYRNMSTVAKIHGIVVPKDWQQFVGTTQEFVSIKLALQSGNYDGIDGYIKFANTHYKGDMQRTHTNVSAVAKMYGIKMPKNWQGFKGSTEEFASIKLALQSGNYDGIDGYIKFANTHYKGNMEKCYSNVSAVAKMYGIKMPKNWQGFHGTTQELTAIKQAIETGSHNGVDGYIKFANTHYKGKAQKTYANVSAVAKMYGIKRPKNWHQFVGTTQELAAIKQVIETGDHDGVGGYIKFANTHYKGNMLKTYINVSAVAKMYGIKMPKNWHQFKGSTDEFASIKLALQNGNYDGIDGYIKFANTYYKGNMEKCYPDVSAVTKMYGIKMPENWQEFHGTTLDAQKLIKLQDLGQQLPNSTLIEKLNAAAIANMSQGIPSRRTHSRTAISV